MYICICICIYIYIHYIHVYIYIYIGLVVLIKFHPQPFTKPFTNSFDEEVSHTRLVCKHSSYTFTTIARPAGAPGRSRRRRGRTPEDGLGWYENRKRQQQGEHAYVKPCLSQGALVWNPEKHLFQIVLFPWTLNGNSKHLFQILFFTFTMDP